MANTENLALAVTSQGMLQRLAGKDIFLKEMQAYLAEHSAEKLCVAAIDMTHMKLFNEWYGQRGGDALLDALAECLDACHAEYGWPVGYFGNDDFFLAMPEDDIRIRQLHAALQHCVTAQQAELSFFIALGICPVRENSGDGMTLCNCAQLAVKMAGPGSGYLRWYQPTMLRQMKQEHTMLTELGRALKNHEFCFYLQPKCNSMTRTIVGMEALVRWDHPTRGIVSPGEFVPLLESTGLITQLDLYIWESVCKTLRKWKTEGGNLVPVSVNVSIADVQTLNVAEVFADLVEKYELEPRLLLVEITESMMAQNIHLVEDTISALHRKGFSVLMDDFGSGYSSLNMLKDTSIDAIKLDMKLINLDHQNRTRGVKIVESVIGMAHKLNLPIIAEGVETPEQVYMLQSMDCLYTQGYYFYKPMPVENAEALLEQPSVEHYWDVHRDLMHRERYAFGEHMSETTAIALQTFHIFEESVLELSRLNLITGEYHTVHRDPRLPEQGLDHANDFEVYCTRLTHEKIVHPDDVPQFKLQTELRTLREALFHTNTPLFFRFRQFVSAQFAWVTLEFVPCHRCSPENPWAAVIVREDAQADLLSQELNFTYNHDTLTGVFNRSQYERDLRSLPFGAHKCITCLYLDAIGLHEVNNHLGHRAGDTMLCTIANAALKHFSTARVYRIGGDEFVVLAPDKTFYEVWVAADSMRFDLRQKEYEVSIGIKTAASPSQLPAAINDAETAMRQEKQVYYESNGSARQLRGLNEKLEHILEDKRDIEHFLREITPRYRGVYVVDLEKDALRGILLADQIRTLLEQTEHSAQKALHIYNETFVAPEFRDSFSELFDFDFIRNQMQEGKALRVTYRRVDGIHITVRVSNYSQNCFRSRETLWIFRDEDFQN